MAEGKPSALAEPCFDATAFAQNRPRLEEHGVIAAFFDGVVKRAIDAVLTGDEHFGVDGTLIRLRVWVRRLGADKGYDPARCWWSWPGGGWSPTSPPATGRPANRRARTAGGARSGRWSRPGGG